MSTACRKQFPVNSTSSVLNNSRIIVDSRFFQESDFSYLRDDFRVLSQLQPAAIMRNIKPGRVAFFVLSPLRLVIIYIVPAW